jgi:hypothetical protein
MKRSLFYVLGSAALLSLFLSACGGGGGDSPGGDTPYKPTPDQPGKIPGLGDTPGRLQGTSFTLPAGVTLVGEIRGATSLGAKAAGEYANEAGAGERYDDKYAYIPEESDVQVGSGGGGAIKFKLLNKNSTATEVVFPSLLIAEARPNPSYGKHTNGVLLKTTSVTVPPGKEYTVILLTYSGNLRAAPPFSDIVYDFAVVSGSSTLKDLADRLTEKRINVEEYGANYSVYYGNLEVDLSHLLLNLTDRGVALSDSDKNWLGSLDNSNGSYSYMPPILPRNY